ncbi:MAG: O-antigen ligase family protein [Candidatus Obscuribacterales bacterium]|nr:O-antigen ligase family protein [Candidatus Obscuribacterales bacterium]
MKRIAWGATLIDVTDSKSVITSVALALVFLAPYPPQLWDLPWTNHLIVLIWMLVLVTGAVWLSEEDKSKVVMFLKSPLFILSSVYILSALVSTGFVCAQLSAAESFRTRNLFIRLFSLGYLPILLFAMLPKKPSQLNLGVLVVWLYSFGFSLLNVVLCLESGFRAITPMHNLWGIHKNIVGDVSATGGLITVALLLTRRRWTPLSYVLLVTSAIFIVSVIGSNARACLLCFPITIVCIVFAQGRSRAAWTKFVAVAASCAALVVGGLLIPQEKQEELTRMDSRSSAAARPRYWALSWQYLQEKPFSPVGYGRMAVFEDSHVEIDNPCNFFLQAWLEVGLPGAVAYTIMSIWSIVMAFNLIGVFQKSPHLSFLAATCLGLQILRFVRDGQDLCLIGYTLGMALPETIGITMFLYMGVQKARKMSRSA